MSLPISCNTLFAFVAFVSPSVSDSTTSADKPAYIKYGYQSQ